MGIPGTRSPAGWLGGFLTAWLLVCVMALPAAAAPSVAAWDVPASPRDAPLPRSAVLNLTGPNLEARAAKLARTAPDGPDRALAALGLGVAEVLSGKPGPGADRLAGVSGLSGALADVAAYYQGLGRSLDNQPDRARQALAGLVERPAASFLGRDALYLSLLCSARLGDHPAVLTQAMAWLASPDPSLAPHVWLRAAVAANALGDSARCQDFLRHLSLFAPASKAAKAGDALARTLCPAGSGGCYDPDAPGNLLLRAEGLAEKGYGEAALSLLGGLAGADAGQLARADYIRGKALYGLRRSQAAREAFARAAAADPRAPLAGWARYHQARCLWRSLDPEDSGRMEELLRQVLAAPGRDDRLREAAARHLALMLAEQGRFAEALTAAEKLTGLVVSPDLAAQGAGLTALLRLATRDFARAEADCTAFANRFPEDDWADGARYWRGKTLAAMGRPTEAAAVWREVAAGRPNTYYGGRAAAALGVLAAAADPQTAVPAKAAIPAPRPARCPGTPQPADPAVAAVLAAAGECDRAELPQLGEMLLDFATRLAPDRADLALAHIRAADATGRRTAALRTAWRTFGACLLRGSADELAPLRQALYPRAYAKQVEAAVAGSGVSPDIIYSLIRQESFFDPAAVSGAGAVGLMQMLPETARAVAKRLGLRLERADLFDPDLNIRIGTAFFLDRLARCGNLPAALAGYNAGENRVALWNRTLAPLGEELFIELIPYTETRDYVRRILANAMMYGRLYGAATH